MVSHINRNVKTYNLLTRSILLIGEFGRTSPSISSIINQWIDIIALDVMQVDLDWPPKVDNMSHTSIT